MVIIVVLFFIVFSSQAMDDNKKNLHNQQNNLFRGAQNGFLPLIDQALQSGLVTADITRITNPSLEARLFGHNHLAELIDQCKDPSRISPTGTASDWTKEKLAEFYYDSTLYLSLLHFDKIIRTEIL